MSGVEALATLPNEVIPEARDIDSELSAIFDRDMVNNGANRAEDGKFISPNPANDDPLPEAEVPVEGEPASELEGADKGEGAAEPVESTLPESTAPLPPSWQHKKEVWEKLTPEARDHIAAQEGEFNVKLSDQGRQIAQARPLMDTVAEFKHLFEPKGIKAEEGIRLLAQAQQNLENPQTRLHTLLSLVDGYGAREAIAAILTGQAQLNPIPQQSLSAEDLRKVVREETAAAKEAEDLKKAETQAEVVLEEFSKTQPLLSQIPTEVLKFNIFQARQALGQSASPKDVLARAFESAVYADPNLRAKYTAAQKAPVARTVSPADAKRANAVNVPSTATGKVREPSEDELLAAIYDRNQRG